MQGPQVWARTTGPTVGTRQHARAGPGWGAHLPPDSPAKGAPVVLSRPQARAQLLPLKGPHL